MATLASLVGGHALAQTAAPVDATPVTVEADAPATPLSIAADPALTLVLADPAEVQIDAAGGEGRDAQLQVRQNGRWIADDTDSGPGTDARVHAFLAAGTYEVVVSEYQHRAMTATVTAVRLPPLEPVARVVPGTRPVTVEAPEGAWAREASVEVEVTVAREGDHRLQVSARAPSCSPEVTVLRDGVQVDRITTSPGVPIDQIVRLPVGTHRLRLRDWNGHACPMSLTVRPVR